MLIWLTRKRRAYILTGYGLDRHDTLAVHIADAQLAPVGGRPAVSYNAENKYKFTVELSGLLQFAVALSHGSPAENLDPILKLLAVPRT